MSLDEIESVFAHVRSAQVGVTKCASGKAGGAKGFWNTPARLNVFLGTRGRTTQPYAALDCKGGMLSLALEAGRTSNAG